MRIQPWLAHNVDNFPLFSQHPGVTTDGELIQKPEKEKWVNRYAQKNRNSSNITSVIGNIWEEMVKLLLPPGTTRTGQKSPHDFEISSWISWDRVLLELKTAQMRNRWVIRKSQISRYMTASDSSLIYFAQLFYQTRSGIIPSKVAIENLETEFLPICLYIFPISFVLYMVSTCQPCWNNPDTQFYAMTQYRAQALYNLAEWWYAKNTQGDAYTARVFRSANLDKNPEMPIYVVDHANNAHILAHITPPPPSA